MFGYGFLFRVFVAFIHDHCPTGLTLFFPCFIEAAKFFFPVSFVSGCLTNRIEVLTLFAVLARLNKVLLKATLSYFPAQVIIHVYINHRRRFQNIAINLNVLVFQ